MKRPYFLWRKDCKNMTCGHWRVTDIAWYGDSEPPTVTYTHYPRDTRQLTVITADSSDTCHHEPMGTTAWVARLYCGHDIGGHTERVPAPGDKVACTACKKHSLIMDVITNEPLRHPESRRV